MPQLVKGGKWVFGWAVVGPQSRIALPPEAQREYGFEADEEILFLRGSRRSGGFSASTPRLLAVASEVISRGGRVLSRGQLTPCGCLAAPPEVELRSGQRLLVVRGSGYALGFVAQGPIYEAARCYPDAIEVFACSGEPPHAERRSATQSA